MPTTSPSQVLEQVRSHYLSRLQQAIADHPADGIVKMVPEAVLRGADGKLLRRGDPVAPVRVDLVSLLNGQVRDGMNIESETMPGFTPFSLKWKHEMPVRISPFPWNACPIVIPNPPGMPNELLEWFENHFDTEETETPGEDGLIGVVHSIARTGARAGSARYVIDLGSASIDAFQEMLDALHAGSVTWVEVGGAPPEA